MHVMHIYIYKDLCDKCSIPTCLVKGPLCCPTMPYLWPLNDGLHGGQLIRIKGVFPHSSDRFDINLQVGDEDIVDNIPLQISLRQSQGVIVLNTKEDGKWLTEQLHDLPIPQGSTFEIVITCEPQQFVLEIDGKCIGNYLHILPMTSINELNVAKDVTLTMISLESKDKSSAN